MGSDASASVEAEQETASYQRRKAKRRDDDYVTEQGLRFEPSVRIKLIRLSLEESLVGAYEAVSEKVRYRLARRPASDVVLKYICPVVKRKNEGQLITLPARDGLWPGSMVDVRVVAEIVVDKFTYHLPLYRQHQRMAMAVAKTNSRRQSQAVRGIYWDQCTPLFFYLSEAHQEGIHANSRCLLK